MDSQPLVSIIIPVYKTEQYLRRCIDCLCNQTYHNIEIIAVNDGSPDNCLSILREYEAKDKRVVVFDKENGGANTARNYALQRANGNWVSFVDSDDWLDINYYKELMSQAEPDCQLICGGFRLNENGPAFSIKQNVFSHDRINAIELLHRVYFGMLYNVWGKVFKKDIIINNNLYFRSFLRDDGIFLIDYLMHVNNITIVSTSSYLHYNTENTNSNTHKMYGMDRIMLDLYKYHNSFEKLAESDYSNYDRYMKILYMDKSQSFCNILHETYPLSFKQRMYWYKRMIYQLPYFNLFYLSKFLNKSIHKWLKLAFNVRSPLFIHCIVECHLIKNRIRSKLHI